MYQEKKQTTVNNHNPPKFTAEDRNAMRAYLARCEVRLSTMHRVAVGFLSGAGLLFLLPVFLKDGVLGVINAILDYSPAIPNSSGVGTTISTLIIYVCLLYPFLLSISIPAVALLLLKDIVRFYFVGHPPSFPEDLFNPRFVLTGVAFSPDESEEVKARVLRYQYGTDLINFVISHADAQSSYYHDVIDKPDRMIVPRTRKLPNLIKQNIVEIPSGKALDDLADDDVVRVHGTYSPNGDEEEILLHKPFVDRTVKDIDGFNAALGLAGFIDRTLYQEVALTEVTLVRHALKLRRLVLRYFQALLILIWTSVITFIMLPFLQDERGRFPLLLVFATAYFIWAILAPFIVQLPLQWLASSSKPEVRRKGVRSFQKSDAIQRFGTLTQQLCYAALVTSVIAIMLEIFIHLA